MCCCSICVVVDVGNVGVHYCVVVYDDVVVGFASCVVVVFIVDVVDSAGSVGD